MGGSAAAEMPISKRGMRKLPALQRPMERRSGPTGVRERPGQTEHLTCLWPIDWSPKFQWDFRARNNSIQTLISRTSYIIWRNPSSRIAKIARRKVSCWHPILDPPRHPICCDKPKYRDKPRTSFTALQNFILDRLAEIRATNTIAEWRWHPLRQSRLDPTHLVMGRREGRG